MSDELRRRALLLTHYRYLETIPAYRRVAERRGVIATESLDDVVVELLLSPDIFKSFDQAWLHEGRFDDLTVWLSDLFFRDIAVPADAADIDAWRSALREQGVFVTVSSGTSGKVSLVPKDASVIHSQRTSQHYIHPAWPADDRTAYDLVSLVPPGIALGLQAAATGLAASAHDVHHLHTTMLSAGNLTRRKRSSPTEGSGRKSHRNDIEDTLSFIETTRRSGRRLMLFGSPFELADFCDRVHTTDPEFAAPPRSAVFTGGGWKAAQQTLSRKELGHLVEAALAIPAAAVIDAYSASELTTVLMTCPEGNYHVPPTLEVRLLDDAWRPIDHPRGPALLAFLDPYAVSYPGFIVTDDEAEMIEDGCPCGCAGRAIVGPIQRRSGAETRGCGGAIAAAIA